VAAGALALVACGGKKSSTNPPVVYVSEPHYTGYHVPSSSMEPTLHCGRPGIGCLAAFPDSVEVQSLLRSEPKRGDILAFRTPPAAAEKCGAGGVFLKRVVGLPDETVSERRGEILIDGRKLDEPYVAQGRRDELSGTWRIPKGNYFLLGDNRSQSCDSREWGPVPRKNIVGEIVRIYRRR
jgi:signal peptidase I